MGVDGIWAASTFAELMPIIFAVFLLVEKRKNMAINEPYFF